MALRDEIKKSVRESNSKASLASQRASDIRNSKVKFLFIRTWLNYFLSFFLRDSGKIPSNIGNTLQILNNMYITQDGLHTIFKIVEFGGQTPVFMIGYLTEELRRRGNASKLSMSLFSKDFYMKKNDGIDGRVKYWESVANDEKAPSYSKARAARLLYTYELYKKGVQLYDTMAVIYLHSQNNADFVNGTEIISKALTTMGCTFDNCNYKILQHMQNNSILGHGLTSKGTCLLDNAVIAQIIPNYGAYNDEKGIYIGNNLLTNTPYRIDFSNVTIARNMYIVAPSGVGKTVLAMNIVMSAYENGHAVCLMDIKGNEYSVFCKATNGYSICLRENGGDYINSWIMHKEDVEGMSKTAIENYFKNRIQFSKQQIIVLSGLTDKDSILNLESALDNFYTSYYSVLGAEISNVKSWKGTENITPFEMYKDLEVHLINGKEKYKISDTTLNTLRMYFTKNGTKSYIFEKEFDYNAILRSRVITFDFGLLSGGSVSDSVNMDILKLKFLYMSKLNADFSTAKYNVGQRTLKVLEESQIVNDDILHIYAQEYTLRRSQNQDTLLIGNSVAALRNNITAKPIIESTTALFVSRLNEEPLKFLIEQFELEKYEPLLRLPGSSTDYSNSFALINKMQKQETPGLIRVEIPKDEEGKFIPQKVLTPDRR